MCTGILVISLLGTERGQKALLFCSFMLALNTLKINSNVHDRNQILMFLTETKFYVHPNMSVWKWRSFSPSWLQAIAGTHELVLISNEAACCRRLAVWPPLQRKDGLAWVLCLSRNRLYGFTCLHFQQNKPGLYVKINFLRYKNIHPFKKINT